MSTHKTISDAGYKATNDPYTYKNGNSTVITRPGQGIIVNNGGNNHYGYKTSDSFLANRIKKVR